MPEYERNQYQVSPESAQRNERRYPLGRPLREGDYTPNLLNENPVNLSMEWSAYLAARMSGGFRRLPMGNGDPVVLVPGFSANDESLVAYENELKAKRYKVYRSGIGTNTGSLKRVHDTLADTVDRATQETGKAATLIGQSKGGMDSLVIAHRMPGYVDAVFTLGSPLTGDIKRAAHPAVAAQAEQAIPDEAYAREVYSRSDIFNGALPEGTNLYSLASREDGVVKNWASRHPYAKVIPINSTHIGMGWNPHGIWVVIEEMADNDPAAPTPLRPNRGSVTSIEDLLSAA